MTWKMKMVPLILISLYFMTVKIIQHHVQGVEGANVFTKADVNGANTRPTYKFLKEQGVLGDIAWNFAGKFLVDKEGNGTFARDDMYNFMIRSYK